MFICEGCGNVTEPRTPRTLVTVETRGVTYPYRKDANARKIGGKVDKKSDKGGHGREIVREIALCPACVAERAREE